jgi:hypothetical protein
MFQTRYQFQDLPSSENNHETSSFDINTQNVFEPMKWECCPPEERHSPVFGCGLELYNDLHPSHIFHPP